VLGIFSAGTSIGSVTGGVGGTNTGIQNTPMGPAPTWSPFHRGGPIRAHNGLAVDEVPVIAQTGEYVLSRKDVRGLGGFTGIDSLVRGGQSIAIQPTIVIQAVDAKTGVDYLLRNKDTIGKIVSEQILKDMALRRINQRYA
jgi:hypothetical protein